MQFNIHSKNLKLSAAKKKYLHDKILKLATFASRIKDESSEIRLEIDRYALHSNKEAYKIEVTMYVPRAIIRAEHISESIEGAVDDIEEKLKKQIKRYKEKYLKNIQKGKKEEVKEKIIGEKESKNISDEEGFELPNIIRRKRYKKTDPLTEEEAINQMELIGHTFFLFLNADTSRYSVVYKRNDEFYGIVEPHMKEDFEE